MNKLKLILILSIFLYSCSNTKEKVKMELIERFNYKINDTIRLNDGHLYYHISTHSGLQPIHSQYCKQKHY